MVSASEQTAGRGRSGHVWQSPPGTSISTSMLIYPKGIEPERLPEITILSALSVANAVEKAYFKVAAGDVKIKWPNDVLLNQKKLSGILTELCFLPNKEKYVVVGIGVNVFQKSFPADISETATSLWIETKLEDAFSKKEIIEDIWENFLAYYDLFQKTGDLSLVKEKYEKRLINIGRIVKVLDPKGEYEAKALGIDERGRLMIEKDEKIDFIDSGEVSIRGILGYV